MSNNLIGTDPNQVPSNADLGTIAYQDAHALGNITASSATLGGRTTSSSGQIDLTITRSVGGGGALKLIGDGYLTGGSHVIFEYKASSGASATTQNISYDGTKIYSSGSLELQSGAPGLTLNANTQGTDKKKVRLAVSQYTSGDFNIQQMNDAGTSILLNALQVNNGGELIVAGTASIKGNMLTLDSDYGHWSGRHQTLVCHNAITGNQVWTDVAFVSYSPSLTIQGTSQRDNSGSLGMASYFGTIFGGYGSVTVTATTSIASPQNSGGFGQLEYRYMNGGASSGAYRLQVRQAITTGTMYITTTLRGQAFSQITED